MLRAEATSPSQMSGKASTAGLGPSSPFPSSDAPTGPPSPPLVHFSDFTANSSCTFLDSMWALIRTDGGSA